MAAVLELRYATVADTSWWCLPTLHWRELGKLLFAVDWAPYAFRPHFESSFDENQIEAMTSFHALLVS